MTPMRITWICEPGESPSFHLSPDEELVRRVAEHAGVDIPRVDGQLVDHVPAEGFILLRSVRPHEALAACRPEEWAGLAARVIAMDVSRSRIFSHLLDGLGLAAAIDYPSHLEWQRSGRAGRAGLFGQKAVAAALGAICDPGAGSSDRYCYLTSEVHDGLPHLLADYLRVLGELRDRA